MICGGARSILAEAAWIMALILVITSLGSEKGKAVVTHGDEVGATASSMVERGKKKRDRFRILFFDVSPLQSSGS